MGVGVGIECVRLGGQATGTEAKAMPDKAQPGSSLAPLSHLHTPGHLCPASFLPGGAPRLLDRCLQQLTADRLAVMVMQQASGRQGGVEAVVTLHRRVSIERVARCDAETARLLRTTLAAAHGPPGRLGLGVMRGRGG